jgi:hypothetical protein
VQSLAVNGYSADAVRDALHAKNGTRMVQYRYDLLDQNNSLKGPIDVKSCSLTMRTKAAISRTARMTVLMKDGIDWLSDRVRPWFRMRMPDGGWAEWPLGTFILATPSLVPSGDQRIASVDVYDFGQLLSDDHFSERYIAPAGSDPVAVARQILQSAGLWEVNLPDALVSLQSDIEFEPNTSKLTAINALLNVVNYVPLWFDEYGVATSSKATLPIDQDAQYTYRDDELSVIADVSVIEDGFGVPNSWRIVSSDPASGELVGIYRNTSLDSPYSITRRGRTISRQYNVSGIPNQAEIDRYARRVAYEETVANVTASFITAPMPHHQVGDVLCLEHKRLGLSGLWDETDWSMDLAAGGRMQHSVRKVVVL